MSFEVQILLRNAFDHIKDRRHDLAIELLSKARNLNPKNVDVLRLLSIASAFQFNYIDALEFIDEAINLEPANGVAYSNRGNILKELGRYSEALESFDRAIELSPNYHEAYSNKGNVLQDLYQYKESLSYYDKAIKLFPEYSQAYTNKANALEVLGYYGEALSHYNLAIQINPNNADAYWNKSASQLRSGDFEGGWQNYEARWFMENPIPYKFSHIPRLQDLSNLHGKKILVWAEQGLGDTIQFCRYLKLLSSLGAVVTFEAPNSLLVILRSLTGNCVLTSNILDVAETFDYQSPLLSLPLLFNTRLETIPADVPYLKAFDGRKISLESQIPLGRNLKVGIVWNGGLRKGAGWLCAINNRRNIELEEIARLQVVTGVDFYSLQKGEPAESELRAKKDTLWPNLIECSHLLEDFSDTAAVMECLDLIISVDTSSAHLAGALGRPVWILNRYDSCWRWLRGRTDSPWYPSATLYQQNKPGDWMYVIETVCVLEIEK